MLARDEESEATTQESMFSLVRVSEGGKRRFVGPQSEITIARTIGEQYFGDDSPVPWAKFADAAAIREVIAAVVPGYGAAQQVDHASGREREFFVSGRHPREGVFATDSGKANIFPMTLPIHVPETNDESNLRLMTIRSEGQFNTVVYEEEDRYRGQTRRDIILLAAEDLLRLGITEDHNRSERYRHDDRLPALVACRVATPRCIIPKPMLVRGP